MGDWMATAKCTKNLRVIVLSNEQNCEKKKSKKNTHTYDNGKVPKRQQGHNQHRKAGEASDHGEWREMYDERSDACHSGGACAGDATSCKAEDGNGMVDRKSAG